MNTSELQDAHRLLDKIKQFDSLRDEIADRDVDFVEGDRRRALGRMQLDPTKIDELLARMKSAAVEWFNEQQAEMVDELARLGVDTSSLSD